MSIITWLQKIIHRTDPQTPRLHRRWAKPSCRLFLEELETRLTPSTTLSIANASKLEPGPGGSVNMDFTVNRTGDLTSEITVGYTTVAGTAQAGTDFTPTSGTTMFASGSSTANIAIPIKGNGVFNSPNLTFSVKLTGVTKVVGPPVTLAGHTDFSAGVNSAPISVAVGDLNGDGLPDIVVADDGSHSVSVFMNTTSPGAATPTFAAAQTFATGNSPTAVAIGDLNGDGKPDLAITNFGDGTVSVLLNTTPTGSAVPSFATHVDFATGSGLTPAPESVAIRDLNGDGKPDLVVANGGSNSVSVFLNTTATGAATPTFASKVDFATGANPRSVAIGDLNGDGKPDIVTANQVGGNVSVLLNTTATGAAAPSFATHVDFAAGTSPDAVAIADLNGDGKPDLAVVNNGASTVSLLRNTTATGAATPSFAAKQDFATGVNVNSVAIGDLNGDGKLDLVAVNEGSNSVSVLRNTTLTGATTFTFSAHSDFTTGAGTDPRSVALGDFNGDGTLDLAIANFLTANVSVFLNTTVIGAGVITPSFPEVVTPPAGIDPPAVALGDFNGDGKLDLVVANETNPGVVSVLMNTTTPGGTPTFAPKVDFNIGAHVGGVAVGDFNGDGKPDLAVTIDNSPGFVAVLLNTTAPGASTPTFAAPVEFAAGKGPRAIAIADFNGDGKPDIVTANLLSAGGDGAVSVFLNTTTPGAAVPSFAAKQDFLVFGAGEAAVGLAVGDLNGDGKPDVAVAVSGLNQVWLLLNSTTPGSLTAAFSNTGFGVGLNPRAVAIGDLNGDGKPDLAVANRDSNSVSVLRNLTAQGATVANFAAKQDFTTGNTPVGVAIADLNGDGKLDIVTANAVGALFTGTVSVLRNATTPGLTTFAFSPHQDTISTSPTSVAIGDLNGDGHPDIVVPNVLITNDVSVLQNTPVTIAHDTAIGTIIESDPAPGGPKPKLTVGRRRWGTK
jgi:hypothetical protein